MEDEATQRLLCRKIVESLGYECRTVNNGGNALVVLSADRSISFVLCDLNLPGMSGLDVLEQLRRMPGLEKLPFVMCTAKTERAKVLRAIELGCQAFLRKPFTSAALKEKLEAILPQNAASTR